MIVLTAPTSQIGSKVARLLADAGAALRLIVRDASRLPDDLRERSEVIVGSHGDPAVVDRAFAGASALFWLVPAQTAKTLEQTWIDFTRPAAAALRRQGAPRVVAITAIGRGTRWQDRAGPVTASIRMDDLMMESGVAYRGLAMPSFMENTARQAKAILEKGMFFGPIDPDRQLPFTATDDMAAEAARWLRDPQWVGQQILPLVGPEDLSFDDQARILSTVIGRPVQYRWISYDQFRQQFLDRGASASFAQGYVDMYRAKEEGIDNTVTRGPATTARTSFREYCERAFG